MIDLTVQLDPRQMADINKRCDGMISTAKRDAAIKRAAKRAADVAKTETKRQLTALYTLPAGKIASTISSRANVGAGATMKISSGVHSLPDFKGVKPKAPPAPLPPLETGQKRKKRRVQTVFAIVKKGGGGELKRAFPAKMKTGHIGIFERKGKSRNPIGEKFGPATTGMVKANPDVNEPVLKTAMESFSKRAEHEISRILEGK